MSARQPVVGSVYRLADMVVLFTVTVGERAPRPLVTEVSGQVAVVAYTDEREADADRPPGGTTYQVQVSELLADLPDGVGLVIGPRAPSPVYIPAADREAVIRAALPFPTGARVRLGEPKTEPVAVLDAIRGALAAQPGVLRAYRCWYQAADAREQLLIAVDFGDAAVTEDTARALRAVTGALAGFDYEHPVITLPLAEVPPQFRRDLVANARLFHVATGR